MGRRRPKPAPSPTVTTPDALQLPEGHEFVPIDARELAHVQRAELRAQQAAYKAYYETVWAAVQQIADVRGYSKAQVVRFLRAPLDGVPIAFPPGVWQGFEIAKNPPEPLPQPQPKHAHDRPKEASS